MLIHQRALDFLLILLLLFLFFTLWLHKKCLSTDLASCNVQFSPSNLQNEAIIPPKKHSRKSAN